MSEHTSAPTLTDHDLQAVDKIQKAFQDIKKQLSASSSARTR